MASAAEIIAAVLQGLDSGQLSSIKAKEELQRASDEMELKRAAMGMDRERFMAQNPMASDLDPAAIRQAGYGNVSPETRVPISSVGSALKQKPMVYINPNTKELSSVPKEGFLEVDNNKAAEMLSKAADSLFVEADPTTPGGYRFKPKGGEVSPEEARALLTQQANAIREQYNTMKNDLKALEPNWEDREEFKSYLNFLEDPFSSIAQPEKLQQIQNKINEMKGKFGKMRGAGQPTKGTGDVVDEFEQYQKGKKTPKKN